jgi:hypothetical protein
MSLPFPTWIARVLVWVCKTCNTLNAPSLPSTKANAVSACIIHQQQVATPLIHRLALATINQR